MLLPEEQYESVSTKYYFEESKSMPKLFANGCSITIGAELGEYTQTWDDGREYQDVDIEYRTANRWSTKLAEKLDMEPVNIARGGGSNWRTWRTTQDFVVDNQIHCAVIQMTEPSRFQIPISYDFISKWQETDNVNFFNWAYGGIYSPEKDLGGGYEEFSHWNTGEMNNLFSFQNHVGNQTTERTQKGTHYENMRDELAGYWLFNTQIQNYFDYLRHVLYLHNVFQCHGVPHLIIDALEGWTMCQFLKKELETIAHTQEDKLFLMLESNPKMFGMVISDFHELDRKVLSTWFEYIRKSQMSKRFNKLFKTVATLNNFDGHSYRKYFSKITMECPREGMNDMYIGSMPNGHPDEAAHLQFAERMFSEIKRRNIL
tara:strand:- start:251 stop:1369 length:1119 start_codon:yes stop_codon:yes gene_type:complete